MQKSSLEGVVFLQWSCYRRCVITAKSLRPGLNCSLSTRSITFCASQMDVAIYTRAYAYCVHMDGWGWRLGDVPLDSVTSSSQLLACSASNMY